MPLLIEWLARSRQHQTLYHFTDTRNLAGIRQHGLLSVREIERRGIDVSAPGGNRWSRDADRRFGMDAYVHLCLMNEHPMEYVAKTDKRIVKSAFIPVSRQVLLLPGVLFSAQVANEAGAVTRPLCEADEHLDLEVVYQRTDWHDPAIQERRRLAKKYEILVPSHVPVTMLNIPLG